MAGGDRRNIRHPWSSWDVTRGLAKVAAHAVGDVGRGEVSTKEGQPRMALPTLVSYPTSHAYRDGGSGLLWDSTLHQLVEPNVDEREHAMGFMTGVTAASLVSEASRRQVLGQAIDLNCLTWQLHG
ncbi:hypothetical protein AXG93_167s1160 [Marchantia polymorpha subsp. ruderalis]|uniref:Uncharacterized protein n=1 Tax=Marchantia polymorpha subsp. ruderalis TaxID=1480154 RepID=A0A176WQ09_MARPO|nr:hypothetical protein AXG93_167s1160 [Marchantia polymorpha subsp. ruderalis]